MAGRTHGHRVCSGAQMGLNHALPWIHHCGQDLCAVLHPWPVPVLPLGAWAGTCLLCLLASGGGLPSSEQLTADFRQQPSNQGVCWKGADHILWDLCWCALTRAASLLLPLLTGCQNVHSKQETGESSFLRNLSVLFCAGALVSLLALSLQDGREGWYLRSAHSWGLGVRRGWLQGQMLARGFLHSGGRGHWQN